MDDIRAQLDALMGQHRDVPLSELDKYKVERKFSDKDICKYFLCGFCPHEEFRRTKNDCGDCPLVHNEGCKQQWVALDDRSKERYGYEAELLSWFDRLLSDLRKRIDSNTERLKGLDTPLVMAEDQQRLDNLTTQINDLLGRAATLGEEGDVDGAQAAAADAERLKVQRGMLEQQAQARANAKTGRNLHQKVCQVSGLIINDEESRLQDHYSGRNYNSWKKLHEVHAQLVEAQRRRRSSVAGGGASSGGREYRSSSYRDDRDRERDTKRYDDRDRRRYDDRDRRRYDDRDRKERRRSRSRSRDRERRRERSRDRGRDYRRRSRSREQERARLPPKDKRAGSGAAPLPPAHDDLLPVAAGPQPYGAPPHY